MQHAAPPRRTLHAAEALWTVDDLVRLLRVTRYWVYDRTRASAQDPIPHFKLGRSLRFSAGDVREWLNRRFKRQPSGADAKPTIQYLHCSGADGGRDSNA